MANLSRIIQAAAQAALEDGSQGPMQKTSEKVKGKGLSMPRALLVGAGLFTAGRLLVRSGGRGLVETLQDRLEAFEHEHGAREDAEGAPEDDYDEEFDDEPDEEFDDEPEGEFDEDEEPEDDAEEPEDDAEEPEDEADEPEDEADELEDEAHEPDDEDEEPQDEEPEGDDEPEERPRGRRRSRSASR